MAERSKPLTLLDWAQRKTADCPDCGGTIPNSWVKMTAWCGKCNGIWRIRRSELTWRVFWFYLNNDGKVITREKNANPR